MSDKETKMDKDEAIELAIRSLHGETSAEEKAQMSEEDPVDWGPDELLDVICPQCRSEYRIRLKDIESLTCSCEWKDEWVVVSLPHQ